jgi:DNA-binding MarR family transcriptional regulator
MSAQASRERLEATAQAFFQASALLDPARMMLWDREGLTVTQLRLLGHVYENEGIGNADLAERLYVTRPSVSALLERLERGKFIRREISPNDRRGIRIFLEDRGRDVVTSVRTELLQYMAELMESLNDADLEALRESLCKFVESGRQRRARDLRTLEEV